MIREFFVKIASFGQLGQSILGGIVASLLALPSIYFLNFVNNKMPSVFWILAATLTTITALAILFSLKDNEDTIVINKFFGTLLAFFGIPFAWKITLIGFILFHVFVIILPRYIIVKAQETQEPKNSQESPEQKKNAHSKFLNFFLTSLASGITVNAFLRFALWVAL
jgi:predicted membrane protein